MGHTNTVTVTGVGATSAVPDVVRVALGVRVDGDDVAGALSGAAHRLEGVTSAVKESGVAARDLSSTGAGVQPRYDRQGERVVGYTAYHQLQVVVRDVEQVGAIVVACAASAGNALTVDAITLDIADRAPFEREARDAAFALARAKAEQFARLSGATLGEVRAVAEGGSGPVGLGPEIAYRAMAPGSDARTVQPGEHTVSAQVTVVWSMVPA